MTAIATSVTDSVVANVALGVLVGSDVTYSAPASAAMPPDSANATSFGARRRRRHRLRRTLVVAHGDDRAPDAGPPELRQHREAHDEEAEAQVVVGAARREVHDARIRLLQDGDLAGERVDAQPVLIDQPVLDEHRERERRHREVQAGDAKRGDPDDERDRGADEHTQRDGDAPRHVVEAEPPVADQAHGDEASDRREAELAERELSCPPAQDRERATGDREDHHPRPEERLRRLGGERGNDREDDENRGDAEARQLAHRPRAPDPFGQRLGPARELPRRLGVGRRRVPSARASARRRASRRTARARTRSRRHR